MEEDIKILEKFLSKTDVDYAEYFNCIRSLIPDTVEIAIKNILSGYKELELTDTEKEVVEAYRNLVKISGKDTGWIVCDPTQMYSTYFIPASKVKEKIEEYRDKIKQLVKQKEYDQADIKMNYIYALEELLGEE